MPAPARSTTGPTRPAAPRREILAALRRSRTARPSQQPQVRSKDRRSLTFAADNVELEYLEWIAIEELPRAFGLRNLSWQGRARPIDECLTMQPGRACIPDSHRVVQGRRNDARAVGREGCGLDAVFVSAQYDQRRARLRIPYSRRGILRRGDDAVAVGGKRRASDPILMPAQDKNQGPSFRVPHVCGLILSR